MSRSSAKVFEFDCPHCGERHRGSPSFSYKYPVHYFGIPEAERAARIKVNDDLCVIDDEDHFIRGLLKIPIHDVVEPFAWGVWVSQSKESFDRYVATFDDDQTGDGSFGWLEVTMPGYRIQGSGEPNAVLGCNVDWQSAGRRPLIRPKECEHPLYRDFSEGIPWTRAMNLAQLILHPE